MLPVLQDAQVAAGHFCAGGAELISAATRYSSTNINFLPSNPDYQAPCETLPGDPLGPCIPCIKARRPTECGLRTYPTHSPKYEPHMSALRRMISLTPLVDDSTLQTAIHGEKRPSTVSVSSLEMTGLNPHFEGIPRAEIERYFFENDV
jgi:hypothetical protein